MPTDLLSLYEWYSENHQWTVPLSLALPAYIPMGTKVFLRVSPYLWAGMGVLLLVFCLPWGKKGDYKDDGVFSDLLGNLNRAKLKPDAKTLNYGMTDYVGGKVTSGGRKIELTWGEWWCLARAYYSRLEAEKRRVRDEFRLAAATGKAATV